MSDGSVFGVFVRFSAIDGVPRILPVPFLLNHGELPRILTCAVFVGTP
jgi:hypothetical protein